MYILQAFLGDGRVSRTHGIYEDNGRVFLDKFTEDYFYKDFSADDSFISKFALLSDDNKYKLCDIIVDNKPVGKVSVYGFLNYSSQSSRWCLQIEGVEYKGGFSPNVINNSSFEFRLNCSLVAQQLVQDRELLQNILNEIYVFYGGMSYDLGSIVR